MGVSKDEWYGKIAVYTAVIGDFEHLGDHDYEDGVDYLFFTDGHQYPINPRWQPQILTHFKHVHPRRLSKLPKHNPHFFDVLRRYRYVVWIDGDMQIAKPTFVSEIMSLMDNGMVISPHFDNRHCAYGEATIRPPKYQSEPMDEQVQYYMHRGFPENFGLYETGVIARDMTDPRVQMLGQQWYIHNMVLSYQDQVSLPFVMWDMGYRPSELPQSFREYNWVAINAHKFEDSQRYENGRWHRYDAEGRKLG